MNIEVLNSLGGKYRRIEPNKMRTAYLTFGIFTGVFLVTPLTFALGIENFTLVLSTPLDYFVSISISLSGILVCAIGLWKVKNIFLSSLLLVGVFLWFGLISKYFTQILTS